jgi:uncharacterized protein YhaN
VFDDVTVHADPARTTQILDLLLEISKERQVILFSQEQQVTDWARNRLTGEANALRELAPVKVT